VQQIHREHAQPRFSSQGMNSSVCTQNPNLWRRNQPGTETDTEREKERKLAELATQVHNQILSATLKN
jgi:hypothetical protein